MRDHEGPSKGNRRAIKGQSRAIQGNRGQSRVLKGHSKGTRRALKGNQGHSVGQSRALSGAIKGAQWGNPGHSGPFLEDSGRALLRRRSHGRAAAARLVCPHGRGRGDQLMNRATARATARRGAAGARGGWGGGRC
eukprot:1307971-Prymnesium_polylepis.1